MAFTERYITSDAAGGNDGSQFAEGGGGTGPWTLPEFLTSAVAGDRGNAEGGTYPDLVADAFSNAGTVTAPIVLRGCNTAIGDLDNLGRNADGTLNTTNVPDITLTGILLPNVHCLLQNLDITGALSSTLIGDLVIDQWHMLNCRVINTQNNSLAQCVRGDNFHQMINCDFSCTGAAHGILVNMDQRNYFNGCRFETTSTNPCVGLQNGVFIGCSFFGNGSSVGISCDAAVTSPLMLIVDHCTFQGIGRCIVMSSATHTHNPVVTNCHATDSSEYFDNTSATTVYIIEANNRTRDITSTLRTGLEPIIINEVLTDTGGASTDYVDAGSNDFRLIAAAPGYEKGMTPFTSIGAAHITDPAGGGGGLLIHPGMTGGVRG